MRTLYVYFFDSYRKNWKNIFQKTIHSSITLREKCYRKRLSGIKVTASNTDMSTRQVLWIPLPPSLAQVLELGVDLGVPG